AGAQYSVQANLMASDKVWPAMAKAYESTRGDLAERLLAALEAAQAQGGDIRGKQSAAILVVSGTPSGRPWSDRTFDLRVEDSPDTLQRAYQHMNAGDAAAEKHDGAAALREYGAAEALAPDNDEMLFWHAISM